MNTNQNGSKPQDVEEHFGPNRNGDSISMDALRECHPTFEKLGHVFREHKNRGEALYATLPCGTKIRYEGRDADGVEHVTVIPVTPAQHIICDISLPKNDQPTDAQQLSDTPITDAVMPESTNWHFPDSDEYTTQRKAMQRLEHELAEARKAATHQQNGRTASAQGWALLFEAAIEQRDMLAEALKEIQRGVNCDARSFVIADKALATVKGGEA